MSVIAKRHDEPRFEIQMRGYCRSQVDAFVASIEWENNTLRTDLARAEKSAASAQEELAAAGGADVQYERLSGRLGQIWRLAEEEAGQKRAQAEAEITNARNRSLQQIEQLENEARAKSDGRLAEARAEADMILSAAHAEASSLTSAAREQADRTIASARDTAERMLSEAHQRATVVNEEAANRLHELTGRHGRTVRDLTAIFESLGTLAKSGILGSPLVEDTAQQIQDALPAPRSGSHVESAADDGRMQPDHVRESVRQMHGEVDMHSDRDPRRVS